MRPSRFTEAEIVQALEKVKAGMPAVQVCRTLGITQTTFYRWRGRYEVVSASDRRDMRDLRDENQKLKQLVANLMLDRQGPTDTRGRR